MTTIHGEIKKWGNSLAFIIPSEKAQEMELEEGIAIDVEVQKCKKIDAFGIFKEAKPFKRDPDDHKEW